MPIIREDEPARRLSRAVAGADLGFQVSRLSKLMRAAFENEIEHLGLTATQAAVLLNMDSEERAPIGEIAKRLGIDRPTMSGVAERLTRDGWIAAELNPDDGRSKLLTLKPKSIEIKSSLEEASQRVTVRALAGLGSPDTRALIVALEHAATNLTVDHTAT